MKQGRKDRYGRSQSNEERTRVGRNDTWFFERGAAAVDSEKPPRRSQKEGGGHSDLDRRGNTKHGEEKGRESPENPEPAVERKNEVITQRG